MAAARFCKYQLRTTDLAAARAFYAEVLGADFWGGEISLVPLPERAAAMGAPPNWLGHLGVADVDASLARMVAAGGQPLGPLQRNAAGASALAVLRDPFGAVFALGSDGVMPTRDLVALHVLNTEDNARAFALYAELFGWTPTGAGRLGGDLGRHQMFAWDDSGRSVGVVTDGARAPGIHPQWMFCFRVTDLAAASARVRALGGHVLPPQPTAAGDLVSACDDPQGAAFGLYQATPAPA
jgi:predicted enzyme related to lactoylglutathione lyase